MCGLVGNNHKNNGFDEFKLTFIQIVDIFNGMVRCCFTVHYLFCTNLKYL